MINVSIVIPCYNYAKYVQQAIDSALNQTYENIEVIVVNDGSTDNSDSVIREYDNKIVYINKENTGVADTRNVGIAAASGNWVLTLDADDVISKYYVEDAIQLIENEYSLITAKAFLHDSNLNYIGRTWPEGNINYNELKLHKLIFKNYIVTTSLFSKELWSKVGGFNTNLAKVEDWEFWLRLVCNGVDVKYICNREPYLLYRVHGNGKSTKNKHLIDQIKIDTAKKYWNHSSIILDIIDLYNKCVGRDPTYQEVRNLIFNIIR